MMEKKGEIVIETVRGKMGEKERYVPIDLEGRPIVPEEKTIEYNEKGRPKKRESRGRVVDTSI